MNFDEYQAAIEPLAVYPRENQLNAVSYLALGLNGEAGEVAEAVKKAIRNDGAITNERRAQIIDELGDVLWYLTRLASEFDCKLETVAQNNFDKLTKRRAQNNLKHE